MKKIYSKLKNYKRQRGMTYVELIVVLTIFTAMSSVALYNYGLFQSQVEIKNLANDIALKVVEAQKSALSGKFPPTTYGTPSSTWKPSYGMFFDIATVDNKNFVSYVDLDNSGTCNNGTGCQNNSAAGVGEVLDTTQITKGSYISGVTAPDARA